MTTLIERNLSATSSGSGEGCCSTRPRGGIRHSQCPTFLPVHTLPVYPRSDQGLHHTYPNALSHAYICSWLDSPEHIFRALLHGLLYRRDKFRKVSSLREGKKQETKRRGAGKLSFLFSPARPPRDPPRRSVSFLFLLNLLLITWNMSKLLVSPTSPQI